MTFNKEYSNIYLVAGIIIAFFIFMFVTGVASIEKINKGSSAQIELNKKSKG